MQYAKTTQGAYVGIGDSAQKAFLAAQEDALTQHTGKPKEVTYLNAVKATYGSDIGKCHKAIFLQLGGFDRGFGEITLDDIPIQPAPQP